MTDVASAPRPPLLQERFGWGNPGGFLLAWCPGCRELHGFRTVSAPPAPAWKLDVDASGLPTLSPSLVIAERLGFDGRAVTKRCHAFLWSGAWHYLEDCGHELKGTVVDVPPEPGRAD